MAMKVIGRRPWLRAEEAWLCYMAYATVGYRRYESFIANTLRHTLGNFGHWLTTSEAATLVTWPLAMIERISYIGCH